MRSEVSYLFLDLNSFFASCEQQLHPHLRNKPIAVVPSMVPTTSCIAASYEAKAFGIKTGTLVRDAKKLCPKIILVDSNHKIYMDFHHRIIDAIETCVPIEKVASVDEFCCSLTGSQKIPENALALARKVKNAIASQVGPYLKSSIGISTNSFLAKVGSDYQKPDGLTLITKEDLPHKLLPLPIRAFPGIGPRMENRLNVKGIRTMEELYACSKVTMRSIWGGIGGERFYELIRGNEIDLPASRTRSIGHQHVLAPQFRNLTSAFLITRQLLEKAIGRLRRRNLYASFLFLQVKFLEQGNALYYEKGIKVFESKDSSVFQKALADLWQNVPHYKPFRVGITLSGLVELHHHQLSFFDNPKKEKIADIIDGVNLKFGKNTLCYGNIFTKNPTPSSKIAFQRIPDKEEF